MDPHAPSTACSLTHGGTQRSPDGHQTCFDEDLQARWRDVQFLGSCQAPKKGERACQVCWLRLAVGGLGLQAHPQKDMRVRALAIGLKAARGGGSPIF